MRFAISSPVVALWALGAPPISQADQSPSQHTSSATAQYKKALNEIQSQKQANVEQLFKLASAAAAEIERDIIRRDEAVAEGQSAPPVVTQLDGLVISTEEALFAKPDPRFFVEIGDTKGRRVDRAFFRLLARTRPDGAWPVYLEQQTDVTGCTRFENPALLSIYKGWLGFQEKFPAAYNAEVDKELREMESQLLTSSCACGSKASVIHGLEKISNAIPKASITLGIKKRLQAIRAGTATFRFSCISG